MPFEEVLAVPFMPALPRAARAKPSIDCSSAAASRGRSSPLTLIQSLKIVAASFLAVNERWSFFFLRPEKDGIFECGPHFTYKLASD